MLVAPVPSFESHRVPIVGAGVISAPFFPKRTPETDYVVALLVGVNTTRAFM